MEVRFLQVVVKAEISDQPNILEYNTKAQLFLTIQYKWYVMGNLQL